MGQGYTLVVRLFQCWTMTTVDQKSVRVLKRLRDIPFCSNSKIRPYSILYQKLWTCLRKKIKLYDCYQKICRLDD